MDWSYVAGYFDGEGHVSMHQTARGTTTRDLIWYNSHLESLEAIQAFMQAGHINVRQRVNRDKPVYALTVSRRVDLLRVLDALIPHLIIKRESAEQLRELLADVRDESPNFGAVAAVSTEQLTQWYHDEGKSYAEIARMLGGVSPTSIAQAFRLRKIPRRPAGGAHLKGTVKSEETRARMKAAQHKMWQDPEFRAAQLKNLSKGPDALRKKRED